MTAADHPQIGGVGLAAWASSDAFKGVDIEPVLVDRARDAFDAFAQRTEARVYVAEENGKILGWGAQDGAPNYVSDLWVHPEHQGRGVGRALLTQLVETIRAEGHDKATIQTQASNTGAIRLYERCGFKIVWRGMEFSKSLGVDMEKVHLEKMLT